jgi:hypothetical protein
MVSGKLSLMLTALDDFFAFGSFGGGVFVGGRGR